MNIGDAKIDQELVYRSLYGKGAYGPRISVTEIQRAGTEESQVAYQGRPWPVQLVKCDRIIGVVIDSMEAPWPVGSQFLGLARAFLLPEDVPA
ncbi:unnamed protein product [marine sediment metagenome]|uniref:Uncharacterized protein n=1 Tax=marine sediment metagenome TaxID=412755 RepID=X1R0I3_9ZZZZ